MRKIAVAMAKGGVGKTTTAVNLAHGLASRGKRVLLVDCDTQGQAAKFLGQKPEFGLYEFVTERQKNGQAIARNKTLHSTRENLWLLDGGIRLVELKNWLGEQPREIRQTVLAQKLVPRQGALDYLIFDCAPGWDVLSVNILMAANEVLCPVALQGPSLEGLKTFFRYLQSAQKLNPDLRLDYILPTMFDRRTRASIATLRYLRERYATTLWRSVIPIDTQFREASRLGIPLSIKAPNDRGSLAYGELLNDLLEPAVQGHPPMAVAGR